MNLCILLGAAQMVLATDTFTLAWTHSVEKTRWEEDWNVGLAGLQLVEVRIEGSGAGMEPPEGAVFDGHVWRYHPSVALFEDQIMLARSGATVGNWEICSADACQAIPETGAADEGPAILKPCP